MDDMKKVKRLCFARFTEQFKDRVIKKPVVVGKNCLIHPSVVLGGDGFSQARNEDGSLQKIYHFGGIVIGDNVEILAGTCVARGTVDDTVIGDGTHIDQLVHIAHNVKIGRNCQVVSHSNLGGSCVVGDNCVLGMSCVIKNHVTLGDNVFVGAGAVVLKDVPSGWVVVGNPARFLRMRKIGEEL